MARRKLNKEELEISKQKRRAYDRNRKQRLKNAEKVSLQERQEMRRKKALYRMRINRVIQATARSTNQPLPSSSFQPSAPPSSAGYPISFPLQANSEQRAVLSHLKTRPQPFLVFVHGSAGTGKTFLLHLISSNYASRVCKMAFTGRAASLIGATTIHSTLALGRKTVPQRVKSTFQGVQVIIIDEASMVGLNLASKIDRRLQEITGSEQPYGGLSMLFFGDLRQLPPVGDVPLYTDPTWFDAMECIQLTTTIRHVSPYARFLERLATGKSTEEDLNLLQERVTDLESVPQSTPLLFSTNREVDHANLSRLREMEGTEIECVALDSSSDLKGLPTWKTKNLPSTILLKQGFRYMLTRNIDVRDGLVNGSIGTLRLIEKFGGVVRRVWMVFENPDAGLKRRVDGWIPIPRWKAKIGKVYRTQFPLVLGEAMTIHKAQGMTLKRIAVHLTPRTRREHVYVAASRVSDFSQLDILGEIKMCDDRKDMVEKLLNRFRTFS